MNVDKKMIEDYSSLTSLIFVLFNRKAQYEIDIILSTSTTHQEARERLIILISNMRLELNINPSVEFGMQHPDEWDILPQPVVYIDENGKEYDSVPEKAYQTDKTLRDNDSRK